MAAYSKNWKVHVYRPRRGPLPGERYVILDIRAASHESAIKKAKDEIYKRRKLAHFYTYVATLSDNQLELIK